MTREPPVEESVPRLSSATSTSSHGRYAPVIGSSAGADNQEAVPASSASDEIG